MGEDHGLKAQLSQVSQFYQGDGHQLIKPGVAFGYHLHPHPGPPDSPNLTCPVIGVQSISCQAEQD